MDALEEHGVQVGGYITFEVCDPDGTIVRRGRCKNGVTTAGLTHILNTQFAAGTQVTQWYFGVIDNSGFSALSASDTMGSHAGWTELGSAGGASKYDETARQAWSPTVTAGSASNGTVATFTMNASVACYGAFITSSSTKGGTTGTLWATAAFSSVQNLVSGQTLKLTYTCTATAS